MPTDRLSQLPTTRFRGTCPTCGAVLEVDYMRVSDSPILPPPTILGICQKHLPVTDTELHYVHQ